MSLVAGVLSLLIGIVLGLLGGGGAILTLPMLVYVVGVEAKAAIAMSLFVVGTTSLVGVTLHARARRVRWKLGATFGAAAMLGALLGGRLAQLVPATVLLVAFAAVMLVTAIAMFRGRRETAGASASPALAQLLGIGAAVGVVSGLVGAGGGFLIVPALTLLGGLAMHEAVGTSLFVIALQSFAGFAGHASHTALDMRLATLIAAIAVGGMIVGAFASKRVASDSLRRAFAWLVLAMGLFVIGKQLSPSWTALFAAVALSTVLVVTRKQSRISRQNHA